MHISSSSLENTPKRSVLLIFALPEARTRPGRKKTNFQMGRPAGRINTIFLTVLADTKKKKKNEVIDRLDKTNSKTSD